MLMPRLLHFIICDRIHVDTENLHRINVEGLRFLIRSLSTPPFPCTVPMLNALAIFMGGEGICEIGTRIFYDATGEIICASTTPQKSKFYGDPFEIKGVKIRLPNCRFPRPGLYWVELTVSDEVVSRQPIRLR